MRKEEKIVVNGASIQNTCMKCFYGKIIDPKALNCSMYKEKPSEVYFGGQECPNFYAASEDEE